MRAPIALAWLALIVAARVLARPSAHPDPASGVGRLALEVPATDASGPIAGARVRLSLLRWPGAASDASLTPLTPIVCLHGSPGSARNFERLAPRLSEDGREVWALDLPGFGRSRDEVGGRSIAAHAHSLLAALDVLGLERAHLVAWSMGGGVALHAADLAPERVASIALVASIGVQETEGTGAWAAEHLKYLALRGAVEAFDVGLPHFGRWSPFFDSARAFARNFQETDQRALRPILERLQAPLLIAHGAGDVLASPRAALASHALVRDSRLVLLDANHFLPILQVEPLARELTPFFARHDVRGRVEPRSLRAEVEFPRGAGRLDPWPFELGQRVPWWLQALVWIALAVRAPLRASALAGLAVGSLQFDPAWTLMTLAAGVLAAARRRRRLRPLLLAVPCAAAGALSAALLGALGAGLAFGLGLAAWWGMRRFRGRARRAEEDCPASDTRAGAPDPAQPRPPTT